MLRILIPTALSGCLLVSACGGDPPSETDRARAAATETLDAFAAGEYAEAWDGLDAASHQAVSRNDWVRLYTALCVPGAEGIRFGISKVSVAKGRGSVRVNRQTLVFTWPMVEEAGAWRLQLENGMLQDFRTFTVEELATSWEQEGLCHPAPAGDDDDVDIDLHLRPGQAAPTAKATTKATTKALAPGPRPAVKQPAAAVPPKQPVVKAPAPAVVKAPASARPAPRAR